MKTLIQYLKESQLTGTYVKLVPDDESKAMIEDVVSSIGIPNNIIPEEYHTTIAFSRLWFDPGFVNRECSINAEITGYTLFKGDGDTSCLVLTLNCAEAHTLHNYYRSVHKATFDYEDYTPHITISYEVPDDFVLSDDVIDSFSIVTFNKEMVSELDLSWKSKVETK